MICDYQTNKVYLAEGIKGYPKVAENLLYALYKEGIETEYLPHSKSKKHVWARDYMPIQLEEGRFLKYVYRPDYLKNDKDYIPNYAGMIRKLGLNCKPTSLVIDGGNVVKWDDAVIMTDKVLKENPGYDEYGLRFRLEELFETDVVFIPWDRYEMFGHADGMVRANGYKHVLLNNYIDYDKNLRMEILERLTKEGFEVEELHYDMPRPSRYSWAYLNFLQTKNSIFVPGLGLEEDEKALEQIRAVYPDYKVILVPGCLELVRDGGALNCVTWNIRTPLSETADDLPM
jgi:hypothetical protein